MSLSICLSVYLSIYLSIYLSVMGLAEDFSGHSLPSCSLPSIRVRHGRRKLQWKSVFVAITLGRSASYNILHRRWLVRIEKMRDEDGGLRRVVLLGRACLRYRCMLLHCTYTMNKRSDAGKERFHHTCSRCGNIFSLYFNCST